MMKEVKKEPDMKTVKFVGSKIILPWIGWQDVTISPEGIHTRRGIFNPAQIDLILWKASFYDRGHRSRDWDHVITNS